MLLGSSDYLCQISNSQLQSKVIFCGLPTGYSGQRQFTILRGNCYVVAKNTKSLLTARRLLQFFASYKNSIKHFTLSRLHLPVQKKFYDDDLFNRKCTFYKNLPALIRNGRWIHLIKNISELLPLITNGVRNAVLGREDAVKAMEDVEKSIKIY